MTLSSDDDILKIDGALVPPAMPLSDGLRRIDEYARKLVFVADPERRLLGVVTDGDVRRWIIAGHDLNRPVSDVMTTEPIVLRQGFAMGEARDLIARYGVDAIPVLDSEDRVVSVVWWVDVLEPEAPKATPVGIPLVVMAGGEGSRLSPYTKVLPKPLMPIGDVPIVELIIERFLEHGCTDVHLTVNYKASLIKAYFKDVAPDYQVHFVDEPAPLGTAGSLSMLRGVLHSTFFMTNCDILVEADYADVLDFHRESGNRMTVVGAMKHFTIPYGVCETAAGGSLTGISEKPSLNYLVSTGMYVMEPAVLDDIPSGRAYHATDLINDYIGQGIKVGVYPVSEKSWMDMGQSEGLSNMLARMG